MNRIVHFEFHEPDVNKALKFYADVFGWKSQRFAGPQEYHLLFTGDGKGIDGGMMPSRDGQPHTFNTIQVQDVDQATAKVIEHTGSICVPKMAIPGVGWLVYCKDPGGVIFGMMHEDKEAK